MARGRGGKKLGKTKAKKDDETDRRYPIRLILFMQQPLEGYRSFSCFRLDEIEFSSGEPPFDLLGEATRVQRREVTKIRINGVEVDACIFARVESGI